MGPNKNEPSFPAGYEAIAEEVAQNAERIRSIDVEIERLRDAPEAGGPKQRLTPKGAPVSREPTNAEKTAYLKSRKEQIQKDSFESVEKQSARETDQVTKRAVMEAAHNKLYGNPYKGMGKEQMQEARRQQGTVDHEHSADYMDAQRSRNRSGPAPASVEQPKAEVQPEKREYPSASYLASQSLNYTRMTEKANNAPDKSAEPSKALDKKGPEKPLLPSEMASLSLNYTVITQHADSVSDQTPDKSPEPAPDKDGPDLNP